MRTLFSLLLVPALCLAQAPDGPRLFLEAPHFDFGKVPPNAMAVHRFKATNTGRSLLTINRLTPTCGCTSTVVGKSTLAPGESTDLEVSFNPAGHPGPNHKSVGVETDDPQNPVQQLTFEADVGYDVDHPNLEVHFDGLRPGEHRKTTAKVASATGLPIRLGDAELSDAPWLGVTTREAGKDLLVDLELLARKLPAGRGSGVDTVTLHINNPNPSVVNLRVYWERRVPVRVSPEKVAWAGAAGRDLSASVKLRDVDGKPFRVLSARTTNPLVQVAGIAPTASVSQGLQVLLSKDAKPGTYDEKAFLTLDTPGQPELEIRVVATLH